MSRKLSEEERLRRLKARRRKAYLRRRADPEWVARDKAKRKEYWEKNRERLLDGKRKSIEKHWGTNAAYRRHYRRANPLVYKREVKQSNDSRIGHVIAEYRRGNIGIDVLHRRLSQTLARCDARGNEQGPGVGESRLLMREGDCESSSSKD